MALLEVADLTLSIGGKPILAGLNLRLEAGQILGIVGESGSGKSSTILSIAHLLPAGADLSGSIRLDGDELTRKSEAELCTIRGRDIGIVFQEPMTALNPIMTIGQQVAETIRLHRRLSRAEAADLADKVLDLVELPAQKFPRSRLPHELSGGQRQRVAIAIAIALKPKLLLADEPTSALDVTTQSVILELLYRLVRQENIALILVSHDLPVVAGIADQLAIMQNGRIVEQGETLPLLATLRHPYSQALFQAARLPPPRRNTVTGPVILQAEGIVRDYPQPRSSLWGKTPFHRAVNDVSLTLAAGESLGVIGESGCGKSTLLRNLLALDRPQQGEIRLGDEIFSPRHPAALRRLRQKIQVVFQDPQGSFNPRWRVGRIVAEPLYLLDQPLAPAAQRQRVAEALEAVGLTAADAERYPHQFSGGQRQRIAIARAIILRPAILALDEATSALDVSIKAQILALLADLSKKYGISLLFVSHDLATIRAITDRVLVMQNGRIVEEGVTEQVFTNPRHLYTTTLLAASPSLDQVMTQRRNAQRALA